MHRGFVTCSGLYHIGLSYGSIIVLDVRTTDKGDVNRGQVRSAEVRWRAAVEDGTESIVESASEGRDLWEFKINKT